MGFPSSSDPPTRIRSKNEASVVAKFLNERHSGHYMVWNLSEEAYDPAVFDNQVRPPARPSQSLLHGNRRLSFTWSLVCSRQPALPPRLAAPAPRRL